MNLHDRDNFLRGKKEGISEGISQGEYQAKVETAKKMLKNNFSLEIIVECTGISLETVEELAKTLTLQN